MHSSSIISSKYTQILTTIDITDNDLGIQIAFPRFQEDLISKLLDEVLTILKSLPCIYNLQADIYIVGDLHGNIRDLIRILKQVNFLDSGVKILFLGDYVDRGEFSVEVITLLFSLIAQYPDRIFLLRGNHEFSSVNMNYGFKEQIVNLYGNSDLWEQFNIVFNWLPIAAIINKNTFCVHGGISPHLKNINQISALKRPIASFQDNNLLSDLMWSDPSSNVSYYLHSERGFGCIFGSDAIIDFCRSQKMEQVIRAHQCMSLGVENQLHGKVITVFSCSNYCDSCQNLGGYLYFGYEKLNSFDLAPLNILKRNDARFIDKKGGNDIFDSYDNLPIPSMNYIGGSFNTGIKNPSRKLGSNRRKSCYSQNFSRQLPIPLSSMHMISSEQLPLNRSSTKSSHNLTLIEPNNVKLLKKIGGSQIFSNVPLKETEKSHLASSQSRIPPLKSPNLAALPSIPESPITLESTNLLPLYQK